MPMGDAKDHINSSFSQILHCLKFCVDPVANSDTASLVISIDVDAGSPKISEKKEDNRLVHNLMSEWLVGKIEEQVIPLLLQAFDEVELPATFALRGRLVDVVPSIPLQISNSIANHEIASHGYSHQVFTSLSELEAEEELKMLSSAMKKINVVPKSFVFPRNMVNHLDLLEKYGYVSFRGSGGLIKDEMAVKRIGNLIDVRPSFYLGRFYSSILLKKLLDVAVLKKGVLHFWFHPWNLGSTPEIVSKRINNVLLPFVEHAKMLNSRGVLRFETMGSIAEKYKLMANRHLL